MSTGPLVIAHRGASGYLPEHTREAKVLAYGQRADFLEQDVVVARDGTLVVLHDLFLDDVSDVAVRFPGRSRSDGRHYVIDFDIEELRQLRLTERRKTKSSSLQFSGRFADEAVIFRIATLDDEIRLVRELNRITGRDVGIYPEIKHPAFHKEHGFDLAARLLEVLHGQGYRTKTDAAVVQCFDARELRRCREELGTRLRLAQLVEPETGSTTAVTAVVAALAKVGEYADILAPHYSQLIVDGTGSGASAEEAGIARGASEVGLALHPYTFRRDALPPYAPNLETLLERFFAEVRVDGVFCDHPDVAVCVRDRLRLPSPVRKEPR